MIPAHWRRPFASPFPNVAQTQVLTAIFAPEAEARSAFSAWRSGLDLDGHFNPEVFRLLPMLYLRLCELGIEDDLMPRLKGVYRHAWVRNAQLFHDTGKALAALATGGHTDAGAERRAAGARFLFQAGRSADGRSRCRSAKRAQRRKPSAYCRPRAGPRLDINLDARSVYHAIRFTMRAATSSICTGTF